MLGGEVLSGEVLSGEGLSGEVLSGVSCVVLNGVSRLSFMISSTLRL